MSVETKVQGSNDQDHPGTVDEGHISTFIQSALAGPGTLCAQSGGNRALSPKLRSESRVGKKRMGLARRGSSRSRKALRLGAEGSKHWNRMLSKVTWPRVDEHPYDEPDISDSDTSDIQSYSEDETAITVSNLNFSTEEVTIMSADTDEDSHGIAGSTRTKKSDVSKPDSSCSKTWRKTMDLLRTSTPVRIRQSEIPLETIADFDSPESSDTDTPMVSHCTCLVPASTHVSKQHPAKSTAQFLFQSNLPSTPESSIIATPPSSLEADQDSRPKASEWIKQVSLDPDASRVGESSLNDTTFVMRTSHDSAKKLTGRQKGRRLVEGGLAERLQTIIQRENAEVAFWEHRVKQLEDESVASDVSTCLEVCVLALTNCFSLFLANCRLLQGRPGPQRTHPVPHSDTRANADRLVMLLVSVPCAKFLDLRVGSVFWVHPPWQCLTLPSLVQDIILCALFCQSLRHAHPSKDTLTSLVPCKHRGVATNLSVYSLAKSPQPSYSCLVRSPVKDILPSQLFTGGGLDNDKLPTCHMISETGRACTLNSVVRTVASISSDGCSQECSPDHSSSILNAIEHAQCGIVAGLRGRVVRVYRRKSPQQLSISGASGHHLRTSSSLLFQSLSENQRACGRSSEVVWCLLVCDDTGMFVEIRISPVLGREWCELVRCGEGVAVHVTGLRLVRRANMIKNPELISFISSLTLVLPMASSHSPAKAHSLFLDHPTPLAPPMFCYILQTQSDSRVLFIRGDECMESRLPCITVGEARGVEGDDRNVGRIDECSRSNLLGKVIHYSMEYSSNEESSAVRSTQTTNCGGYLHVVAFQVPMTLTSAPSATPITSDTTEPASATPLTTATSIPSSSATVVANSKLLMIYLKPSFSVAGLEDTLLAVGSEIILRDVCLNKNGKSGQGYVMDSCSMIVPGQGYVMDSCSMIVPGQGYVMDSCSMIVPIHANVEEVYPVVSLPDEVLAKLRALVIPTLPVIDQNSIEIGRLVAVTGTVVDVDDENAYSWPVCNLCGSGQLSDTVDELFCTRCNQVILSPGTNMELAVFLKCQGLQNTTLLVKLLQSTINKMLPVSPSNVDNGFDVHCVLKKHLHLSSCYLQDISYMEDGTVLLYLNEVDISSTLIGRLTDSTLIGRLTDST